MDIAPCQSNDVRAAHASPTQHEKNKHVRARGLLEFVELSRREWLGPPFGDVPWTPFHAYGIFFKDFVFNADCKNTVENGGVEGQAGSPSRKLPAFDSAGAPDLEGLNQGLVDVSQQADLAFFQKTLEFTDGVTVSLRGRIAQFVEGNPTMQFVFKRGIEVGPCWFRLQDWFLVADYVRKGSKRSVRQELFEVWPEV